MSRDWVFPQIEEWTSLWECFHDSIIQSIDSDLIGRRIILQLKLDVTIPLDVVYLKLPPRIERKAKRMWEKAK